MSLEDRLSDLEKRVQKLEDGESTRRSGSTKAGKHDEIETIVVNKIDEIGTQDLVAIALKMKPKQTKAEIKVMLQDLGKGVGNWFEGSNFNRLLRKGIIKEDGLNEKNMQLYSLTKKGEIEARKMLDKLK